MSRPRLLDLLPTRISSRIQLTDSCWNWLGWINSAGYGYARWGGRDIGVHRIVKLVEGFDLDGMDVDHLCKNTRCVNPSHLEVVTHAENMDRTRPTSCRRMGHDWSDPANVYVRKNGRRWCAACSRLDQATRRTG